MVGLLCLMAILAACGGKSTIAGKWQIANPVLSGALHPEVTITGPQNGLYTLTMTSTMVESTTGYITETSEGIYQSVDTAPNEPSYTLTMKDNNDMVISTPQGPTAWVRKN